MRKWWFLFATGVIAVGASLFLTAPPAGAQVSVCNHDRGEAHFAVAYLGKPSDWIAEGYTSLGAGKCVTLLSGKATPHPYYIYVITASGGVFHGDKNFCVNRHVGFTNDHADVNTASEARNCVKSPGATLTIHGIDANTYRVVAFFRIDEVGKNSSAVTFDSENLNVHHYDALLGGSK